tara:strand:- start:69 stop:194 length:126 start_codon:yes stop_codon:yes gene_type:complete
MQKVILKAFTFALLSSAAFFSQHAVAGICSFSGDTTIAVDC